jgi:methylmalonyl-CoA mutase cobalamin-binding subunit
MAEQIGELWRDGAITAAHEHFFTATAKLFLGNAAKQFAPPGLAPLLIACTPLNQHHELGALMASVAAAHLGWRVIYLGPVLPAAEIAGAAAQHSARAVALSIVHPADDPLLPDELRALRHLLGADTDIIVGGRALHSYAKALEEIGALVVTDLDDFFDQLDTLRSSVQDDPEPRS